MSLTVNSLQVHATVTISRNGCYDAPETMSVGVNW